MTEQSTETLPPLKRFDYALVRARLDGFYFNVERAIQKQLGLAQAHGDLDQERCLSLLLVLIRFSRNSYNAVRYLNADTPPDPERNPNYVAIVPTVNRQLLDLLFSLVYMLDDFSVRSLENQRAGWRDLVEEKAMFESLYVNDDKWQAYFGALDAQLALLVARFDISAEQQAKPELVGYWKTPFKLAKRAGPSQPFLQHLEKWIYKDVSTQAHLTFAGLQKVSLMLMDDLLAEQVPEHLRKRALQSYHFQQVSRTAVIFLAVLTEVDTFCKLGNRSDADYLWIMFCEYVAEAKELYELRYQNRSLDQ